MIKLKTNLTFLLLAKKCSTYRDEFYSGKIENIVPTFKQLSSVQAIGELVTFSEHYVNILFHLALIYAMFYFQIKPM